MWEDAKRLRCSSACLMKSLLSRHILTASSSSNLEAAHPMSPESCVVRNMSCPGQNFWVLTCQNTKKERDRWVSAPINQVSCVSAEITWHCRVVNCWQPVHCSWSQWIGRWFVPTYNLANFRHFRSMHTHCKQSNCVSEGNSGICLFTSNRQSGVLRLTTGMDLTWNATTSHKTQKILCSKDSESYNTTERCPFGNEIPHCQNIPYTFFSSAATFLPPKRGLKKQES